MKSLGRLMKSLEDDERFSFCWRCSNCGQAKDADRERIKEEKSFGSILCDNCNCEMDREKITSS